MSGSNFNFKHSSLFALLLWIMPWGLFLLTATAFGGANPVEQDKDFKGIRISTDQAIIDARGRHTEFNGNVKVTVDDTKIEADWLSIKYRTVMGQDMKVALSEESIEEILAKGNVKITFEDKTATTNQAKYMLHDQTLILTGENSRITSGKDFVTGDKIILDRINKTFKVESSGRKQVEAIFFRKNEKNSTSLSK